jgi:UDP-glucose 4-epimerase
MTEPTKTDDRTDVDTATRTGRTIAVTGATGRIGRAVTAEALRRGHRVVAIDRLAPAEPHPSPDVRFIEADIGDSS